MNISLPTDIQTFVAQELAIGRYASESELVADAVRRMRDDEATYQQFKAQIQERIKSLDRGEGIELHGDEALGEFFDQIDDEVNTELAKERRAAS
jgi:putative addiction module CopG family antidote